MKRRLKDILRKLDPLVAPYIGKRDPFIQAVTEARNRLVHATKETPAPAYSVLSDYALQLGLILDAALLSEIGFSQEKIGELLAKSKRVDLIRYNVAGFAGNSS